MLRHLHPLPMTPAFPRSAELDHTVKIETASGWLDVTKGVYELEASSLGEVSQSWRKRESTSEWVEGSYLISAVRDNVQERLGVWVLGETRYEHMQAREALTDALSQFSYQVMVRIENTVRYWVCQPAEYQISSSREMLHARRELVLATIPRLPHAPVELAALDER